MLKLFVIGISFAAALVQAPAQPPADAAPPKPNDYADGKTWLCRPGRQDACAIDHTTTVVAADGKLSKETWSANPNAPIDCFYVYPTISTDQTPNSDMTADPAELNVIKQQFARFASQCRPYAPLYRQITLAGLRRVLAAGGGGTSLDHGVQYDDVRDAWNYYLKNDNNGRGIVLVAHSQGSFILNRLIAEEIDGKPVQSRLVSAILLGTTIPVPKGKDVGGAFEHVTGEAVGDARTTDRHTVGERARSAHRKMRDQRQRHLSRNHRERESIRPACRRHHRRHRRGPERPGELGSAPRRRESRHGQSRRHRRSAGESLRSKEGRLEVEQGGATPRSARPFRRTVFQLIP